jgi:hypothetical protein
MSSNRPLLIAALAALAPVPALGLATDVAPEDAPSAPVTAEHRYRLSAAIRPLLFWIGVGDVGGARIVWRLGDDSRQGYELLIGSDPARAPRHINRWGWTREDASASGATMLGVMNRSEEGSLKEARDDLEQAGRAGYLFKLIRARIEDEEARAESTSVRAPVDYTMYQLAELRRFAEAAHLEPRVKTSHLPPGTRPGLLFALADLVRSGVAAARTAGAAEQPPTVPFTFNAGVYELAVRELARVEKARYGGRVFQDLVRLELESRNLEKGTSERFTLVCGTEGALEGIPVFVRYQPRWWFKVEGVLDESEGL